MKQILLLFFIGVSNLLIAQNTITPTENFIIEGLIKQTKTISFKDLLAFQTQQVDSIVITNHLHQRKSVLMNVKGVLLKEILAGIQLQEENPKLFSEFYFVCTSTDNYKVVFSWNEIFNNETGKHVLIITEHDGKNASILSDRIALISYQDEATGRRYVKSLQTIAVKRVQ